MKKIVLTSILTLIGFVGAFTSADTIGDFTSDSEIHSYSFEDSEGASMSDIKGDFPGDTYPVPNYYYCVNFSDFSDAFYIYSSSNGETYTVNSENICLGSIADNDDNFNFCEDSNCDNYVSKSGTFYISANPITTIGNVGESGGSGFPIFTGTATSYLSGGTLALKPALDGLKSTMAEFVPYIAYIGLGIIIAVLGFVAIRWLVNRVRAKIFDSF